MSLKNFINNPKVIDFFPFISTGLFELSTIFHIIKMWHDKSASGQALTSWVLVIIGLILWYKWYKTFTPEKKFPIYTCVVAVFVNLLALITVVMWR